MKNKKIIITIIVILCLVVVGVIAFLVLRNENVNNSKTDSDKIPDGYIAVFHGGSGEITYETYIYKIDNKQANYGFKYINVTSTTKSWGSTEWDHKIIDKGEFSWTDLAFDVAKKNGAYSYVTLPNDNETYTIEEFQRMFILN